MAKTKRLTTVIGGAALLSASMLVTAARFDGSVHLLCAVTDTVSCDSKGKCVGNVAKPGEGTTAGEDVMTGAAKGAIIGGIAGDAGKGAAAGAVGSLLFGEMRRNH